MSKKDLGKKRVCPTTGKTFYDLNKEPIVSPYTGEVLNIEALQDPKKDNSKAVEENEITTNEDSEVEWCSSGCRCRFVLWRERECCKS